MCLEGLFIHRDQKRVSNLLGAGITGTYKLPTWVQKTKLMPSGRTGGILSF